MPTIYELIQQGPGFVVQFAGVESTSFKALTSTTTLTLADPRIVDCDPTSGGFSVLLPDEPYAGYTVAVRNVSASTNTITIDGNGININGAATASIAAAYGCRLIQYVPAAGAQSAQYIMVEGNSAGGGAPAAHASTHLAGGSDPLLAAPGTIGGGTAGIVNSTIHAFTVMAAPAADVAKVQMVASTGNIVTFVGTSAAGGIYSQGMESPAATAHARKRYFAVSLADDATLDITGLELGGHGTVSAVGATSSVSGSFSYAANAATDDNGVTYSDFDVADTDTKLCAFASGGNLRIRNRLGSTQTVVVELTQLIAV